MKYLLRLIFISMSLFSFQAVASGSYLQQLEAEAAHTVLDQTSQRNVYAKTDTQMRSIQNKKWQGECGFDNDVEHDLRREEFSSYLKQCHLAVYVFYRRLDMNAKNTAYKKYKESIPLTYSSLRGVILANY